jgi:hypothetical protein
VDARRPERHLHRDLLSALLAARQEEIRFAFTYWATNLISSMRFPAPVVFDFNVRPDLTPKSARPSC